MKRIWARYREEGAGSLVHRGELVQIDEGLHIYANGHEIRWVEVGERTATAARGQVA